LPKIHYALYEDCREQRGSTGQSDVLALLAKHRNVTRATRSPGTSRRRPTSVYLSPYLILVAGTNIDAGVRDVAAGNARHCPRIFGFYRQSGDSFGG
jgi:hypothetical protein